MESGDDRETVRSIDLVCDELRSGDGLMDMEDVWTEASGVASVEKEVINAIFVPGEVGFLQGVTEKARMASIAILAVFGT